MTQSNQQLQLHHTTYYNHSDFDYTDSDYTDSSYADFDFTDSRLYQHVLINDYSHCKYRITMTPDESELDW